MITVNGVQKEWRGASLRSLLDELGIDGRGVAVAIDGVIIRRRAWDVTLVGNGCVVEVVSAVAGG